MTAWQHSGNLLLEKVEVRDVQNISAEEPDAVVVLSRFGGPTATCVPSSGAIHIFSGGGAWIAGWKCPFKLCLGGFGWTEDLALVLVREDEEGTVYIWDDFVLAATSVPRRLKLKFGHPIRLATFWNNSVIGLTQKMSVIVMKDLRFAPQIRWAPVSFPIINLPRTLCVLRPFAANMTDAMLEIAVALPDQAGMLVASPERKSVDARVPQFRALPSRFLVPHPTESILASVDVSNRLLVVNTTWDEILYARDCDLGAEFETSQPVSLSWCMGGPGHCVVLLWEKTPWSQQQQISHNGAEDDAINYGPGALVLGFLPNSATAAAASILDDHPQSVSVARFAFDFTDKGKLFAISEVDGLRVMCLSRNKTIHLIRRVARPTQSVDEIGSLSPAALLLESLNDDLLLASMLDEDLVSAADDLMACAKLELNFERKLSFLRASQRGKDRIFTEDRIEDKARLARKLAELCEFTQALQYLLEAKLTCATPLQVSCLGPFAFACRIAHLGYAKQAMQFARVCHLPLHPFALVQARQLSSSLSVVANNGEPSSSSHSKNHGIVQISQSLFQTESFPRSDCAAALSLFSEQNRELALRLCEFESRFNRKIICLLQLNEIDRVLSLLDTSRGVDFELKAKTSIFCLTPHPSSILSRKGSASLITASVVAPVNQDLRIASHSVAEQAVRATYKSTHNVVKLEKWLIFVSSSKSIPLERRSRASHDRALLLLESAMFAPEMAMDVKKKSLLLHESAKEFDTAGRTFLASQTKDYMQLLAAQSELNIPSGGGKSLAQTVTDCVARGRDDLAEKFRKQFNLKPHLYWRARIKGMGKRGLWLEAARLVTLEKEAGRWVRVEDVLEMCFEQGSDSSAAKIAYELLEDVNPEKARAFVKLRMWPEALKSAIKSRSVDATQEIVAKCKDAEISLRATELMEDLRRNPPNADSSVASSGMDGGLFGFVTGAVKGEPQRCQQQ